MTTPPPSPARPPKLEAQVRTLISGNPPQLTPLINGHQPHSTTRILLTILIGGSIYGASMGLWRGTEMALYTAIKLPLVLLLTAIGNGLLNGVIAALTGSGLSFRQTFRAVLLSFATLSLIAASLSPLTAVQALEILRLQDSPQSNSHRTILLTHTSIIALSGFIANISLLRLLAKTCSSTKTALLTFLFWLIGNLILGAQIGYSMRPFFGSTGLQVQFLRPDPLEGNFYETVWSQSQKLIQLSTANILTGATILLLIIGLILNNQLTNKKSAQKTHS